MNRKIMSRAIKIIFVLFVASCVLLLVFAILFNMRIIVYSPSESIARGFYLILNIEPSVGDLAEFDNPLTDEKQKFYVDGREFILSREDVPYKKLIKRVVEEKEGMLYMLGKSSEELHGDESFDSRFYSYIDKKNARKPYIYLTSNSLAKTKN